MSSNGLCDRMRAGDGLIMLTAFGWHDCVEAITACEEDDLACFYRGARCTQRRLTGAMCTCTTLVLNVLRTLYLTEVLHIGCAVQEPLAAATRAAGLSALLTLQQYQVAHPAQRGLASEFTAESDYLTLSVMTLVLGIV
jgi:hypothetical protein